MKKRLLTFVLFIAAFATNAQSTLNETISHDGGDREYIVYVPASYDPATPTPLILGFHGRTSTANTFMTYSEFNTVADTANCIVVYPQGLLYGGVTHWNVGGFTAGSPVDDLGFVDALLDTLINDYNINVERVYSTGMSNGGYMSFLLACQLNDRIAAIASVTGSMTPETYTACNPSHPTPVLQVHGDTDPTVPYGGASWSKSIDDVMDYWIDYNNTSATVITTNIPDISSSDGSTADQFVYENGDNCVEVQHYKVYGGGHDWCGAWGNMDFDATIVAWNFMSKYDINGLIGCETLAIEEPQTTFEVYPNPATNQIKVSFSQENFPYSLVSIAGQTIQAGELTQSSNSIDVSELTPGIYFIQAGGVAIKFVKR